jgi:branched-chain amino acid transport system ATP-binding protein
VIAVGNGPRGVIAVGDGEVVAVVGAAGAGKTRLLEQAASAPGAAYVPAGRHVFGSLSVAENLTLGAYRDRRDRALVAERRARVHVLFPRLAERRAQAAGTLSGGEQQLLVVARALMSAPRLLVLDEPSAGLGPPAVAALADAVAHSGGAVLLAEQGLALARRLADRIVLLEDGAVVLDAPRAAALADARLGEAYLLTRAPGDPAPPG